MSDDPFEQIGPGSDPETPPAGASDVLADAVDDAREALRSNVKKARDFYNRRDVREVVRKGERLFKIGKDIKTGNPLSWIHATFKVAETLYEFDRVSLAPALRTFKALKEEGHQLTQDSVTHLFVGLLDREKIREVDSSPSADGKRKGPTLYSYTLTLEEGPDHDAEDVEVYWFQDGFDYSELVCASKYEERRVKRALGGLLWDSKGRQIEMQWGQSREFVFRAKAPPLWRYEGEFGHKLIARWQRALELRMRRFAILHGDPGMGKSTLARHLGVVAKNSRVMYVPTDVIMKANSVKYFMDTLALCAPDIVIIDDIDRMAKLLENLLALFEETETKIPLLLATTNDLNRLPDALKRPGRFDEIWLIEPPPPPVMGRVIDYLAGLEGLSLSKSQIELLADLAVSKRLSGAHIREIVRRIKLDDLPSNWTSEDLVFDERDITFSEKWRPSDYRPEGVAVSEDTLVSSKDTASDKPPAMYEDDGDDYYDFDEDGDDDEDFEESYGITQEDMSQLVAKLSDLKESGS